MKEKTMIPRSVHSQRLTPRGASRGLPRRLVLHKGNVNYVFRLCGVSLFCADGAVTRARLKEQRRTAAHKKII